MYMCAQIFFLFFFKNYFIFSSIPLPTLLLGWNACFVFLSELLFFVFEGGGGGGETDKEEEEVAEVTVKQSRLKYTRVNFLFFFFIPHPVHTHTFTTHAAAAAAPRDGSREFLPSPPSSLSLSLLHVPSTANNQNRQNILVDGY
jgi:hypothetical protein